MISNSLLSRRQYTLLSRNQSLASSLNFITPDNSDLSSTPRSFRIDSSLRLKLTPQAVSIVSTLTQPFLILILAFPALNEAHHDGLAASITPSHVLTSPFELLLCAGLWKKGQSNLINVNFTVGLFSDGSFLPVRRSLRTNGCHNGNSTLLRWIRLPTSSSCLLHNVNSLSLSLFPISTDTKPVGPSVHTRALCTIVANTHQHPILVIMGQLLTQISANQGRDLGVTQAEHGVAHPSFPVLSIV
ncbi:hypothetical protein CEK26_004106 [Fusarium fujikuroi]|nr:hypothetical protein CEK27_004100 [Fusarium fujikuroi]QGI77327.1 hypothetical protein CEK25_004056 [Fusarium fujikuroi]QGI91037.1 hypothetical protein CEK26_004106 [Fusarium fujikuroi]